MTTFKSYVGFIRRPNLHSPEAEKVGQIVSSNQFVSGLQSELQAKVVGVEGGMDELVTKARFEEAKLKELSGRGAGSSRE